MTRYQKCTCSHFGGDSPNSTHENHFQAGHGKCNDCNCIKFTWKTDCDENGIACSPMKPNPIVPNPILNEQELGELVKDRT